MVLKTRKIKGKREDRRQKKKIKARKQAISVGKQIHLEACSYKNRGRPVKPASAGTEITKKEEKNFQNPSKTPCIRKKFHV
jgi:hypothetical protein